MFKNSDFKSVDKKQLLGLFQKTIDYAIDTQDASFFIELNKNKDLKISKDVLLKIYKNNNILSHFYKFNNEELIDFALKNSLFDIKQIKNTIEMANNENCLKVIDLLDIYCQESWDLEKDKRNYVKKILHKNNYNFNSGERDKFNNLNIKSTLLKNEINKFETNYYYYSYWPMYTDNHNDYKKFIDLNFIDLKKNSSNDNINFDWDLLDKFDISYKFIKSLNVSNSKMIFKNREQFNKVSSIINREYNDRRFIVYQELKDKINKKILLKVLKNNVNFKLDLYNQILGNNNNNKNYDNIINEIFKISRRDYYLKLINIDVIKKHVFWDVKEFVEYIPPKKEELIKEINSKEELNILLEKSIDCFSLIENFKYYCKKNNLDYEEVSIKDIVIDNVNKSFNKKIFDFRKIKISYSSFSTNYTSNSNSYYSKKEFCYKIGDYIDKAFEFSNFEALEFILELKNKNELHAVLNVCLQKNILIRLCKNGWEGLYNKYKKTLFKELGYVQSLDDLLICADLALENLQPMVFNILNDIYGIYASSYNKIKEILMENHPENFSILKELNSEKNHTYLNLSCMDDFKVHIKKPKNINDYLVNNHYLEDKNYDIFIRSKNINDIDIISAEKFKDSFIDFYNLEEPKLIKKFRETLYFLGDEKTRIILNNNFVLNKCVSKLSSIEKQNFINKNQNLLLLNKKRTIIDNDLLKEIPDLLLDKVINDFKSSDFDYNSHCSNVLNDILEEKVICKDKGEYIKKTFKG